MKPLVAALVLLVGVGTGSDSPTAPGSIVVATARGQATVVVSLHRGHPALAAPALAALLPITARVEGDWAVVEFARQPFRFPLDVPAVLFRGRVAPLVGGAYVRRDTVFVPLQWLTGFIPRIFSEAYRYDSYAARFEEARLSAAMEVAPPPTYRRAKAGSVAARHGFRLQHMVVVDPGHGGRDHGNPGRFLPRGVQEKHVTLAISRRLRDELQKLGVAVTMTRNSDRRVNLFDRAPTCNHECDLFVSIHVNSLKRGPGYDRVSGVETYFLSEARTAEAARVAGMENDALRYETGDSLDESNPLTFILKDLHTNEYLRESALLARFVQQEAAKVHPGKNRGVSQARLVVLGAALRPAILVETGFATNRSDARYLASSAGQRKLARAMAAGIRNYLRQYEDKLLAAAGQ
ncbi:MAG: N-acetylmuramoyl-L-alanine amidase [Gemmatimonadales bacterium]